MLFETPLLTLDLNRVELSQLFHDNRAKWHKLCKNQFSTLTFVYSREHKKEKLLTVMGNMMKVERSYPGGAQIQKFIRAASSERKPPVSFTEL